MEANGKHIKILNWEKNIKSVWNSWQQIKHMIKIVGTEPCSRLCSIPSSFTEEIGCWTFGWRTLFHSCLTKKSSCWTVLGLLWHIFHLMMRQMLDCKHASSTPIMKPCCYNRWRMWVSIILLKLKPNLKKMKRFRAMGSKNYIYLSASSSDGPLTIKDAESW